MKRRHNDEEALALVVGHRVRERRGNRTAVLSSSDPPASSAASDPPATALEEREERAPLLQVIGFAVNATKAIAEATWENFIVREPLAPVLKGARDNDSVRGRGGGARAPMLVCGLCYTGI